MDCGRVREMLAAYHDGELGAEDRARVEEHLPGCGECSGILERLARVDANVDVPDPGPEYWERFNRRVLERIDHAEAPAKASHPERRWTRRLPYFVPAAAAAALLVVILRQTGTDPFSGMSRPTDSASPPEISSQASPEAPGYPAAASRRPDAPPAAAKADRREGEKRIPLPASPPPAPLPRAAPSVETLRSEAAPVGNDATKEMSGREAREEKAVPGGKRALSKSAAGAAAPATAPAPCGEARGLAGRGRLEEAESAQRACLARENPPEAREAGMVYLAELLDRQSRFAEADSVLEDARREFPASRPLASYLRERPQLQGRP